MKKPLITTSRSCLSFKLDLKMKLSALFTILTLFTLHATEIYGQRTKISIEAINISVGQFLDKIENSTDFRFVYKIKDVDLARKINITVKDESITDVLDDIFEKTNTTYNINARNKRIYLKRQSARESSYVKTTSSVEHLIFQKTINGLVTDESGQPLPGASVVEKGTTNGASTDFDGNFSLEVADENAILVISYIGFTTKEVPLNGQSETTIVLAEDSAKLDEVIVTGYTSQRKADLTGAVSIVDVDELTSQPQANINEMVEGRTSGIDVLNSNQPGGNTAIRIRGFSTIRNNDPLYVIDGVPTTTGINLINPNEIESLQILKDASSASIYGSRAANGVVVITTKKGREEKVTINYDGYTGIQRPNNLPRMANAQQYGEGLWRAFNNDGITPNNGIYGNGSSPVIPEFLDSPNNTVRSADTDWVGELFGSAIITSHNVSFSKGSEKANTFFSLGYFKQDGTLKHTGFDRITARINSDFKLGEFIKVGENISLSRSKDVSESTNAILSNPIYSAYRMQSVAPVYNINGDFTGYPINDIENPVGQLYRNRENEDKNFRLFGNVYAEIKIFDGLTFKSNYGLTLSNFSSKDFNPTFQEPNVQRDLADLTMAEQNLLEWTFSNTLNYKKIFNDVHNIDILVGTESIESEVEILSAFRQGFPGNESNFQVLNAGDGGSQQNSGNKIENTLLSYFGKVNYSYDNRYLFSYTIRRDGTSKLLNNKWGTFSAASFGWKISNESFFESEKISDLKLRFGWGQNGNQDIPPYVTSSGFYNDPFNSNYAIDGSQNSVFNGYILSRNSNPDLKWETTEQYNIGLDFGMFNNLLSLTVDYFNKDTKDLLLERSLTPVAGGSNGTIWDNVGEMNNSGFEFSLGYSNKAEKDFSYGASLNMSIIKNELTSLKDGIDFVGISPTSLRTNNFDQEVSRTAVGQPISSFYGWVVDGIFQNQGEIDTHATQSVNTSPGDFRFKDINNDGVINDMDREFIGSPHPDVTFGLNLNFAYKNFDVNAFLRSSIGNKIYDLTRYYGDFYNLSNYNKNPRVLNAWSETNTSSDIPRLSLNDPNNNIRPSSYYVRNGDYLKLQTLQFGYNFPEKLASKMFVSNLRIYLNLQNVFTITNYEGIDPEIGLQNYSSEDRNLDIGVDRAIYPPSTTYTLGLNITF